MCRPGAKGDLRSAHHPRRWPIWLFVLTVVVGAASTAWARGPEATLGRLEAAVNVHGDVVYAALYALPETTELFAEHAPDEPWSSYHPTRLPRYLSAVQQDAVLHRVANHLDELPDIERRELLQRLDHWLVALKQFEVFVGLFHLEQVMSAAFKLPETAELFHGALKRRGLLPDEVRPTFVGETLASAEITAILYGWLNTMSDLSGVEQANYYSAFYRELVRLHGER